MNDWRLAFGEPMLVRNIGPQLAGQWFALEDAKPFLQSFPRLRTLGAVCWIGLVAESRGEQGGLHLKDLPFGWGATDAGLALSNGASGLGSEGKHWEE